jgi:pimeloyl-ACP methyl ester carboxylesterase
VCGQPPGDAYASLAIQRPRRPVPSHLTTKLFRNAYNQIDFRHTIPYHPYLLKKLVYVQARAGRIYVDDAGTGECPVVFVHSLAGNSRQWMDQLVHVRTHGCGVAFDLRGHGRSDPPDDGDYSLDASVDDLLAVIDALGIGQIVLVGHSLGAAIATVFASAHAERVRALLMVDPVGDQRLAPDEMQHFLVALDTPRYDELIRDYWKSIAGNVRNVRDQVLRDLDRTPRAAVIGMLRSLQRTNLTRAIRSYGGPKLSVITALNNFPFSLHHIDDAINLVQVDTAGHWLHMEKPESFNGVLDDFVGRVVTGRKKVPAS